MIKAIDIVKYRKLKNIKLEFSKNINLISGGNGTCKTSLLHIVSNSFQRMNKTRDWLNNGSCLQVINALNRSMNPKIESLTKGDKKYSDPAQGIKGKLYTVEYFNFGEKDFRRHNFDSTDKHRYSVKPLYKKGTNEKLPYCPVIYLGLSRLYAFGEFQNDAEVITSKIRLPEAYQKEAIALYKRLTGIDISDLSSQVMGDIKNRLDFDSKTEGVDANTISAGEDNLMIIIMALMSLKYYYNSITSNREVESVLLVDELDATLHPSLQFELLKTLREFSEKFKIQIICTTHSLSLLEEAFKKDKVIYLLDNITKVTFMEDANFLDVKMYLYNKTKDDIYLPKKIPVFTEDAEARDFLELTFEYFIKMDDRFSIVKNYLYIIDKSFSSESLTNLFTEKYLANDFLKSICILDGDQKPDVTNYIIALPGNESPEELIMNYAKALYEQEDDFWENPRILKAGFTKIKFRDDILPDINSIAETIKKKKENKESTKGLKRELNKTIYNKHKNYFLLLFKHWLNNKENKKEIEQFYKNLGALFCKTAVFHGVERNKWINDLKIGET